MGAATRDIQEMINAGVDFSKTNVIINTGGANAWASDIPANHNCIIDLSQYDSSGSLRPAIVAFVSDMIISPQAASFVCP